MHALSIEASTVHGAVRGTVRAPSLCEPFTRFLFKALPEERWERIRKPGPFVIARKDNVLTPEEVDGTAVVLIAGMIEWDNLILDRVKEAQDAGAAYVFVFVPNSVRVDRPPEYVGLCDGVFMVVPWSGSVSQAELPKKLHVIAAQRYSMVSAR